MVSSKWGSGNQVFGGGVTGARLFQFRATSTRHKPGVALAIRRHSVQRFANYCLLTAV